MVTRSSGQQKEDTLQQKDHKYETTTRQGGVNFRQLRLHVIEVDIGCLYDITGLWGGKCHLLLLLRMLLLLLLRLWLLLLCRWFMVVCGAVGGWFVLLLLFVHC